MIPFNAPQVGETTIRFDAGRSLADADIETIVIGPADQYGLQGEAFAKAIRGVEPLPYGVDDACRMMRLLDAVVDSHESGRWVAV
jgi:predicted dehydrogenase